MRSMNGFETAKSLGAQKKRGGVLEQSVEEKKKESWKRYTFGSGSLPCVMIHGGTQERRVGALERTE